jgi:hypothetical protein
MTVKAYVCGTNWHHECQDVLDQVSLHNDIDSLKESNRCWRQCGIIELEIKEIKWVELPELSKERSQ